MGRIPHSGDAKFFALPLAYRLPGGLCTVVGAYVTAVNLGQSDAGAGLALFSIGVFLLAVGGIARRLDHIAKLLKEPRP